MVWHAARGEVDDNDGAFEVDFLRKGAWLADEQLEGPSHSRSEDPLDTMGLAVSGSGAPGPAAGRACHAAQRRVVAAGSDSVNVPSSSRQWEHSLGAGGEARALP